MFKITKIKMIQLGLGLLCLGIILFCVMHPKLSTGFDRIDGYLYDDMINMNLHTKKQAVRVVVVDIDDYSVKSEGRWPWPRDKLASLITNLKKTGVVVIGMDMVLSEAEINYADGLKAKLSKLPLKESEDQSFIKSLDSISPQVDNDKALVSALTDSGVVLGYLFNNDPDIRVSAIPSPVLGKVQNLNNLLNANLNLVEFYGYNGILPQFLAATKSAGFVSNFPDGDGVLRHGLMIGKYGNKIYSSLALSLVMNYLMADSISFVGQSISSGIFSMGLDVGGIFIPINNRGQILIPFYGLQGTLEVYSASDIMNGKIPAGSLAGSIAVVGSSMILLSDLHESPVSQDFSGVEIVANMVTGILSHQIRAEYKLHTYAGATIMLIIGIIYAFSLPFLGPVALLLTYTLSIVAFLILSFVLFIYLNIYFAVASILCLISLQTAINFSCNFILERLLKNKINDLFGQYLPPSHIKELLESPGSIDMEEDTREMTAFFSDIRNFTTLSEPLAAKDIKRLLNTFFTPVTEIIFTHNGTIDKYVGDMVVAFWGAPTVDRQHAYHAIAASLEIKSRLFEINQTLVSMKLPALNIGIGLSSGMMDVGDMGSTFRRAYTVLGDSVNLASRLQDLTKFYKVQILVSESTREKQSSFFWWPIDKVAVKGRKKTLKIYSPLGYYQDATDEMKAELKEYEQALAAYYEMDWKRAIKRFQKLRENSSNYYLYEIYLLRCEEFIKEPPAKDWDGSFVFSKLQH